MLSFPPLLAVRVLRNACSVCHIGPRWSRYHRSILMYCPTRAQPPPLDSSPATATVSFLSPFSETPSPQCDATKRPILCLHAHGKYVALFLGSRELTFLASAGMLGTRRDRKTVGGRARGSERERENEKAVGRMRENAGVREKGEKFGRLHAASHRPGQTSRLLRAP